MAIKTLKNRKAPGKNNLTAVAYLRLRVVHLHPQGCRQMRLKDKVLPTDL
jgi:hypothetical protein